MVCLGTKACKMLRISLNMTILSRCSRQRLPTLLSWGRKPFVRGHPSLSYSSTPATQEVSQPLTWTQQFGTPILHFILVTSIVAEGLQLLKEDLSFQRDRAEMTERYQELQGKQGEIE
ncbi:MAG: hypothetical protein DHS80DRAFT_29203 [Piptocephalis tieghemiana]|nr:MAG: hypothetical protein DHS80DRAFT_29203 [Piptocephalis tieghemiana]